MRVPAGGMFTPRMAPVKEGRGLPGLPYASHSRRGVKARQGALILCVLLCIPLMYFLFSSSSSTGLQHLSRPGTPDDATTFNPNHEAVVLSKPATHPKMVLGDPAGETAGESPSSEKAPPFQAPPVVEKEPTPERTTPVDVSGQKSKQAPVGGDELEEPAVPARTEEPASKPNSPSRMSRLKGPPPPVTFNERPKFERALQRVVQMLPGEMEGRDLLRQVEGTGKEKLREMGLRVREYKKFFEAWEDLHLVTTEEGGSYVRDDVIQYLRNHIHDDATSDLVGENLASTIHSYEAYRYFLVKFGQLLFPWTAPYFPDHMTLHAHFKRGGRGIVLTAGDDQAPYLLTTIPTFRKLGCDLPIEIMYLGDSDLSEDYRQDLEAIDGVVTRDIAQMVNDEGWKLAGWAAKPFAILFSSFREVIFIDADSLFFKNPETLFEDPGYERTGALFFRDRLIMPENKKRWLQQILPKPISRQVKQSRFWTGDSGHMQESGVVVVDKWRHFMALLFVTRMNGPDRDGNKDEGRVGIYDMVYGDKETFWLGWELVGDTDYSFHQGDAGTMGVLKDVPENEPPKEDRPRRRKKKQPEGENGENNENNENGEQHPEGENPEGEEEWEYEDEPEPERSEPEHYSMCSPQLLHLDLEGNPLWFNGWLMNNKFADKKQKKFGTFESYLIEPHDIREPGQWQLEESNMCCLTTDAHLKRDFTQEEKDLVLSFIEQARQVGITG